MLQGLVHKGLKFQQLKPHKQLGTAGCIKSVIELALPGWGSLHAFKCNKASQEGMTELAQVKPPTVGSTAFYLPSSLSHVVPAPNRSNPRISEHFKLTST
eukprot:1155674-Pelagomonas_calceolata.AAC.2